MNAPSPLQASLAVSNVTAALLPTQQEALDKLLRYSDAASIVFLEGDRGSGKSTIINAFCEARQAKLIGYNDFIERARQTANFAGDAITALVDEALAESDLVVIDNSFALHMGSMRRNDVLLQNTLRMSLAFDHGKKIVICGPHDFLMGMRFHSRHRAWPVAIGRATVDDYRIFFRNILGDAASDLDIGRLYHHASAMNCHELKRLCDMLIIGGSITTERAIAIVDTYIMRSNVKVSAVEELRFDELPGSEHIARKLETHVVLPLDDVDLAERLDLTPKRGVLLYGPPGTGKTSIGRALAHRMKGKFFLIDGNIVTEPPAAFFARVEHIIRQARDNAPSVLFIDDADVLFGIVHISGFARYLLTLLDGMESESVGKVCVVMTAMDVTKVPSAILRSGRIELWLETRAPDVATRAAILRRWIGGHLPGRADVDFLKVAEQAEGFTPADLRRVTADAHAYFAADEVARRAPRSAEDYLLRSIDELIATRKRMADNLRDDSLRVGKISARAKYGSGIGGLVEAGSSCAVKGW